MWWVASESVASSGHRRWGIVGRLRFCQAVLARIGVASHHPLIFSIMVASTKAQVSSAGLGASVESAATAAPVEQAAEAVVQATPAKSKTLLQKALDESGQKKRAKNHKRTTDQVVAKCLYDNFRGWTAMQTDGVRIKGATLRERLVDDRRKARGCVTGVPILGDNLK